MAAPYTIRIFVADGDPDGVRIIDRFNWIGKGFFFPRKKWNDIRKRPEFDFAGVYILFADAPSENGLPIVYVGEATACAPASTATQRRTRPTSTRFAGQRGAGSQEVAPCAWPSSGRRWTMSRPKSARS